MFFLQGTVGGNAEAVNMKVHIVAYDIIYFLFSFHGPIQDYKIHMEMKTVIFAGILVVNSR